MNKYDNHMLSDKRKWRIVFTAIALIIVFLVVMVWSDFFTNWNRYCWPILGGHDYDNGICVRCGDEKPADEIEQDKGGLEVADGEERGVNLAVRLLAVAEYEDYGIMPLAESAYIVKATVYDEAGLSYEGIQEVTFSIAWASTKSDNVAEYVKLAQSGTQATLTCLKAFDTKIILTCTSNITPEVKATKNFGYYKRIESLNFTIQGKSVKLNANGAASVTMPEFSTGTSGSAWSEKSNFQPSWNYGVGTDTASMTVRGISIKATSSFASAVSKELSAANVSTSSFPCTGTLMPQSSGPNWSLLEIFNTCVGYQGSFQSNNVGRAAVYRALAKTTNQFEITIGYSYNGVEATFVTYLNFANVVAPTVNNIQFVESGDLMF